MFSNGFKINECDKCVYVKQTQNFFAILCLYVDDMPITSSDGETIKKIKCLLACRFGMKDMGVADVIIGVKIHKTSGGLALSQSHYIETILGKCKNLGIVPVKTPIDVNLHLSKNTGEKLEMFNGTDFKRWQQKMLFYLTTLNLARFLNEDGPKLDIGETDKEKLDAVDEWNHSDFLCHNYVLNGLENTPYDVYSPLKTAKELWDSLDKKYKTEDVGLKKFIVGKFLDFKMVDSKTVLSQVQELQVVVHDIHAEGMTLSETFQVAAFNEKLPPSWRDSHFSDITTKNYSPFSSLHHCHFCVIVLQVEFVGVLRSVPLRRNEIRSILGDDFPLSSVQVKGPNSS